MRLGPWANGGAPAPAHREVRSLGGGARALVYSPREQPPVGIYVAVQGLHFLGPDDPRMDRFCRALADAGFLVVAPFVREFLALSVGPRAEDDVRAAVQLSADWADEAGLPPPAVFSISFGSRPVAGVLADGVLGRRVGGWIVFGGFADFDATVRFAVTGRAEGPDGETLFLARDPLNTPVVFMNLADHLELGHARSVIVEAWRALVHRTWGRMELKTNGELGAIARELSKGLSTDEREPFLRGAGQLGDTESWLDEGLERARGGDVFRFADPRPELARIQCRVAVVHGRDDDVIPYFEADKIARALRPECWSKTLITGLYGHTGTSRVSVGGIARELATTGALIQTMADAPLGRLARG